MLSFNGFAGTPSHRDGVYNIEELIALAIKNDPRLAALRGDIAIAQAEKRAAKDLRDPELRLSYKWDNDVESERPYEETTTETRKESDSEARSRIERETGQRVTRKIRDSERRSITSTTKRKITPTGSGQRVESTTTERYSGKRTSSDNFTSVPNADNVVLQEVRDDLSEEAQAERIASNERALATNSGYNFDSENFKGSSLSQGFSETNRRPFDNGTFHDESFAARIRFYPPHPWEIRAKIKNALAKISLAEYKLHAAEREVALNVRQEYSDLQFLTKELSYASSVSARALAKTDDVRKKVASGNSDGSKLAAARISEVNYRMKADGIKRKINRQRTVLAALSGIKNPTAILVSSNTRRPRLELSYDSLASLSEMAFVFREDLGSLSHNIEISESKISALNAKKIPWFSFVEFGYGVGNRFGRRDRDSWSVDVGMNLPIFSWFNKEGEIYEAEIATLKEQIAIYKKRIDAEVAGAFQAVKTSSSELAAFDRDFGSISSEVRKTITDQRENPESKSVILKLEEELAKMSQSRVRVEQGYNDAVLSLERIIGADLKTVFTKNKPK